MSQADPIDPVNPVNPVIPTLTLASGAEEAAVLVKMIYGQLRVMLKDPRNLIPLYELHALANDPKHRLFGDSAERLTLFLNADGCSMHDSISNIVRCSMETSPQGTVTIKAWKDVIQTAA